MNQLREYCGRRGIKLARSQKKVPYIKELLAGEREKRDAKKKRKRAETEGKEKQHKDTKKSTKDDRKQEKEELREGTSKQPAAKKRRDKTEGKEKQHKKVTKKSTKDRKQERGEARQSKTGKAKKTQAIKKKILARQSLKSVTMAALQEMCEKEQVELAGNEKKADLAKALRFHWKRAQ